MHKADPIGTKLAAKRTCKPFNDRRPVGDRRDGDDERGTGRVEEGEHGRDDARRGAPKRGVEGCVERGAYRRAAGGGGPQRVRAGGGGGGARVGRGRRGRRGRQRGGSRHCAPRGWGCWDGCGSRYVTGVGHTPHVARRRLAKLYWAGMKMTRCYSCIFFYSIIAMQYMKGSILTYSTFVCTNAMF